MCYDAPTSIGTFAFVSAITLFLWRRNGPCDRAIGLILLVLASMQLLEFVIWTHQGPTDEAVNRAATTLIPILLYCQPLLFALILWIWKAGWFVELYKYIFYGLLACLPLFILYIPQILTRPVTHKGVQGHLEWPLSHNIRVIEICYYILTSVLLITIKKIPVAIALLTGSIASSFYYETYYKQEWKSMWCHAINLIGVVALFP